jgi:hypothetical protein
MSDISTTDNLVATPTNTIAPTTLPSNTIFTQSTTSSTNLETKLVGPSYEYWKNIKSPGNAGITSDGTWGALGNDVNGILGYVQVLAEGGGVASNVNGPLGNKFFLLTGGTCTAEDTGEETGRYIYVNNVPNGNIPFISSNGKSEFKGLIPGIMNNLETLNPFTMLQAFTSGANPACKKITLETIDSNDKHSFETQYITTVDIQNMNACDFSDGKNPITNETCTELFTSFDNENNGFEYDIIKQIFIMCIGVLLLYFIICLSKKRKMF